MSRAPQIARRRVAGAVALGLLLGGCGYSRPVVPNLAAASNPTSFRQRAYRAAGVSIAAPANWTYSPGKAPLVGIVTSGPAMIAVWHYPKLAPPAPGAAALAARRTALLAEIRRHDPSFRLLGSATLTVGGAPAIELDALETVGGHRRRSRSEHVYTRRGEVVLDEYAPVALFGRLDRRVFSPVRNSLALLPSRGSG